MAHLGRAVAGVPLPQLAPQRARPPRPRGRPRRGSARHLGSRPLHGHRDGEVRAPGLGLQPAPACRLPQPHAGRAPTCARLPAGRVLRLPHRRHRRGRRHPVRLVAEDQGHPRRAAHAQLRRLRRPVRRPVASRRRPAGSVVAYRPDVYHRSADFTDPARYRVMLHVSFRHREAGWGGYQAWPFRGFSPELSKYVQQATPRQLGTHGRARRPAIPTGTRRPWPASKPATPAST